MRWKEYGEMNYEREIHAILSNLNFGKIDTDDAEQALIELVEKARARTLTDITVWANNEMAKDYVALSNREKK